MQITKKRQAPVTIAQIDQLRVGAWEAGDLETARTCQLALGGSLRDMVECARIISDRAAASDAGDAS